MKYFKIIGASLFGLIALCVFFVFFIYFFSYLKTLRGTEIFLRASFYQQTVVGSGFGWNGEVYGPRILGLSYEIDTVDVSMFDSTLQADIKNSSNSPENFNTYIKNRSKNAFIYVPLARDGAGLFHINGVITSDRKNIKSPIFIKGVLNGNSKWDDKQILISIGISYLGIEEGQNIVPFVDFYSVYPKEGLEIAVVVLDTNGNANLKAFKVDDKVCASVWHMPNFTDQDCWRDYRNKPESLMLKKYSDFTVYPTLFFAYIFHII